MNVWSQCNKGIDYLGIYELYLWICVENDESELRNYLYLQVLSGFFRNNPVSFSHGRKCLW